MFCQETECQISNALSNFIRIYSIDDTKLTSGLTETPGVSFVALVQLMMRQVVSGRSPRGAISLLWLNHDRIARVLCGGRALAHEVGVAEGLLGRGPLAGVPPIKY